MSQPNATMSDVLPEANTAAVSTDSSGVRSVVDLRIVRALIQEFSHPADVTNAQSTITRTALDSLSAQIAKSAFQISAASLTAEVRNEAMPEHQPAGAPAIILQLKGDYKPGEWVPDKGGIFIGEFDLNDQHGKPVEIKTNWFDAVLNFGRPKYFRATAEAVANATRNGRGGLMLEATAYHAELLTALRTGEGFGKNVIPPLEVVKAIYELRNEGEYKRLREEHSPARLKTTFGKLDLLTMLLTDGVPYIYWSCNPAFDNAVIQHRRYVKCVSFAAGAGGIEAGREYFSTAFYHHYHADHYDIGKYKVRVCFAEPAP